MAFQSGITINPRDRLPMPSVKSSLVSRRELGAAWRDDQKALTRGGKTTNIVGQLQRQINQIQNRGSSINGLHPFEIYQYPSSLRVITSPDDWMKVKIRYGEVAQDGLSGVYGTDGNETGIQFFGYQEYEVYTSPYTQEIAKDATTSINDNWHEFTLTNDAAIYYFWVSCSFVLNPLVLPEVFVGIDSGTPPNLTATSMYDGSTVTDLWPSFPVNDPYHFLIGTATINSDGNVIIRNSLNQDIDLPVYQNDIAQHPYLPLWKTDFRFKGDYDDGVYYFIGDTVTQISPDSNSNNWLYQWVYYPPEDTAYTIQSGPIIGIDPQSNNPDPWKLLSKSPIDASYQTGAFVSSDYYLRK